MTTTSFAIAGAGVFGSWIAYTLRKAGHAVALYDPYGAAHARASSAGESRIIRCSYGADEIYTRMAQRSLILWRDLFYGMLQTHLLQPTGVLWLTEPNDKHAEASRVALKKANVPFFDLSSADVRREYPQMSVPDQISGILEPQGGALMAQKAVQAVVDEFVRLGGVYQQKALPSRAVAEVTIYACGPWLGKIFPELIGQRLFVTRQEVLYFGVPRGVSFQVPWFPVWIDFSAGRGMYGFPDFGNGFKIACDTHGPPIDPDTRDRLVSAETVTKMRAYLGERFPALADAPVVGEQVCQYENTSNGDFIIDRHPEFENVWIVGGGSGHGFKHGPAVAEYLKRVMESGDAEPRFSLAAKKQEQNRAVV